MLQNSKWGMTSPWEAKENNYILVKDEFGPIFHFEVHFGFGSHSLHLDFGLRILSLYIL